MGQTLTSIHHKNRRTPKTIVVHHTRFAIARNSLLVSKTARKKNKNKCVITIGKQADANYRWKSIQMNQ